MADSMTQESPKKSAAAGRAGAADDLLSHVRDSFPEPGANFLGFRLITELGRGEFSRVFLAQQGELGNRPVVLKISVDLFNESQTLAQLQHTNIVPIYSVHSASPFQAVCMPYFGQTTLADLVQSLQEGAALPDTGRHLTALLDKTVVADDIKEGGLVIAEGSAGVPLKRLEKLSYVNAVLWLAVRLADGLLHAHERGIVHRDLKPANILMSDEGEPMLLDFNLSDNVLLRSAGGGSPLGGTLGYMAPEHLEALLGGTQPVDARSDIYALGVILFEMLTGRLPFPVEAGSLLEVLPRRIAAQKGRLPGVRCLNRAVSPAVEAIIHHCLAAEPAARYPSARALADDLQRQLGDLPLRHVPEPSIKERLRKWMRRHPRLTSPSAALTLSAVLLAFLIVPGAWIAWHEDRLAASASETFRTFQAGLPAARSLQEKLILLQLHYGEDLPTAADLRPDVNACQDVLRPYKVLDNAAWQDLPSVRGLAPAKQEELRKEIGGLLYWLAGAHRFQGASDANRPAGERAQKLQIAWRLNALAEACFPEGEVPRALLLQKARLAEELAKKDEAATLDSRAASIPLRQDDALFAAFEKAAQGKVQDALWLLERGQPDDFGCNLLRAVCRHNLAEYDQSPEKYEQAAAAYSICIALKKDFYEGYLRRGQVLLQNWRKNNWQLVKADADTILRLHPGWKPAQVLQARAWVHEVVARCEKPHEALDVKTQEECRALLDQAFARLKSLHPNDPAIFLLRGKPYLEAPKGWVNWQELVEVAPDDAKGWTLRGLARLAQGDGVTLAEQAVGDFERALALDPRFLPALFHKATLQARPLKRPHDALRTFEAIVRLYPDFLEAEVQRGFLYASLGERFKAYDIAIRFLQLDPAPRRYYQAAQVYAATSRYWPLDRPHALKLLSFALRNGYGWERFQSDPCFFTAFSAPLCAGGTALLGGTAGPLLAASSLWPERAGTFRDEPELQSLVRIAPILGRGVPPRMRRPPNSE